MEILYYCRSGYEADLLAEIEAQTARLNQYGYAKFVKNSAYLRYILPQLDTPTRLAELRNVAKFQPSFSQLCFARQKLLVIGLINFQTNDRISEVLDCLAKLEPFVFADIHVEYPDTEEGKKIAKFCKKFTVPLRNALRKKDWLQAKPSTSAPYLHLFFEQSGECIVSISLVNDRSNYALGIQRLKMPSAAPSRSTLKLEEAINTFFSPKQAKELFTSGMRAVDLGACPGGWTYQLIARKLVVEAVDHGEMAENLLATGLVEYYPEDGFLYKPQQANVDWLVCDMIEQPTRVSELILSWLTTGKANACIFNLKLPMSKRFKVVSTILARAKQVLNDQFGDYVIKYKHLYHNRDEVTVMIIVNTQLQDIYHKN